MDNQQLIDEITRLGNEITGLTEKMEAESWASPEWRNLYRLRDEAQGKFFDLTQQASDADVEWGNVEL